VGPDSAADALAPVTAVLEQADQGDAGARLVLAVGLRGIGKTWWLAQAAALANRRGWRVVRATGRSESRPFAAIGQLIGGRDDEVLDLAAAHTRLLDLIGDGGLCIAIDDLGALDVSSRDLLGSIVTDAVADRLVVLATAERAVPGFDAHHLVQLAVLDAATVAALLERRGLDPAVARECAAAARGNPGVAVAIADGLSDAQRTGTAPIGHLPRLGGELAAGIQERMRALGETCCRALVVAAAADGGDLRAVERALTVLSEPGLDALEPAEAAGLVELIGAQVVFSDPFVRHAAFHLLAPASRRAAHRALAAAFDEPHQARARVWHLVGAARGADDALAESLGLLAADAARRGAIGSAVATYEQAVGLAATTAVRERLQASSLGVALSGGDLDRVRHLSDGLVATSVGLRAVLADAREALTGRVHELPDADDPVVAASARRRSARQAALAGDHRAALAAVDRSSGDVTALLIAAIALRHAGRLTEARTALADVGILGVAGTTPYLARWRAVVQGDLELLAGLADLSALPDPGTAGQSIVDLRAAVVVLQARSRLVADPMRAPRDEPTAWDVSGADGALGEVRALMRAGVMGGRPDELERAVAAAQTADLPVELGEARMWLAADLAARGDMARAAELAVMADATLQRCGVRAWGARCAALSRPAERVTAMVDPALATLSQAERRVAEAVAEGLTNREVAAKLFLSVKTVDFHLQQIYRKLALRSRTELAVKMAGAAPTVVRGVS
jgi:DNA-binding NarL/FixJ family response regulator